MLVSADIRRADSPWLNRENGQAKDAMAIWRKRRPTIKPVGIASPAPTPDRRGLAVVTMVKNEAEYVSEWVQFHRLAGIEHFFVYDDGSTDGTADEFRRATTPGELTLIPWSMRLHDPARNLALEVQVLAYAHAISNFGGRFRWMAALDIDEFLFPVSEDSLIDVLEDFRNIPNISLPWVHFGRCGHERKPEGGVVRNFTRRSSSALTGLNFKCIVDPCEVTAIAVHHFVTRSFGDRTSNDAGVVTRRKKRMSPDFLSFERIQLNHYYSKSNEEVERKIARGPVSRKTHDVYARSVLERVQRIEEETVEDLKAIEFLRAKTALSGRPAAPLHIESESTVRVGDISPTA